MVNMKLVLVMDEEEVEQHQDCVLRENINLKNYCNAISNVAINF